MRFGGSRIGFVRDMFIGCYKLGILKRKEKKLCLISDVLKYLEPLLKKKIS